MYKSISINIGLNDTPSYWQDKTDVKLSGCENDADFMAELASLKGFQKIIPLKGITDFNNSATFEILEKKIAWAKANLEQDGILLITYSGHGGQSDDRLHREEDGQNEYWALYDKELLDDKLVQLLTPFEKTQRILIISDSCHSGTIVDDYRKILQVLFEELQNEVFNKVNLDFDENNAINAILNSLGFSSQEFNRDQWENQKIILSKLNLNQIESLIPKFRTPPEAFFGDEKSIERILQQKNEVKTQTENKNIREQLKASVILISACQDWQKAKDNVKGRNKKIHGLFTKYLMEILWEKNQISISQNGQINPITQPQPLNYIQLHNFIWKKLENTEQNPKISIVIPNSDFATKEWFKI